MPSQQRSSAAESKAVEVTPVQEFLLKFRTMTKEIKTLNTKNNLFSLITILLAVFTNLEFLEGII